MRQLMRSRLYSLCRLVYIVDDGLQPSGSELAHLHGPNDDEVTFIMQSHYKVNMGVLGSLLF